MADPYGITPQHVHVAGSHHKVTVEVDGQPFPWPILDGSVRVDVDRGVPTVTFTMIAGRVTVDNVLPGYEPNPAPIPPVELDDRIRPE